MSAKRSTLKSTQATIGAAHVARFRIQRHHLGEAPPVGVVSLSRDVCGLQAQIMSAAFLQAWARNHAITRSEIEDDLWKKRTLIKTSLMRQTLHLIPADEFSIYIAALRSSRLAGALRIMSRFGIQREEADALTAIIIDVLSAGPQSRGPIRDAVRPKVSKRVRAWMDKVWSIMRVPIAEGSICYGAGEGNEATYVRTEQWIKAKPAAISEEQARARLLKRYLRAYGPATLRDFAHWSGMPAGEVRPLPSMLAAELEEIEVEKRVCLLLKEDVDFLKAEVRNQTCVRLLPHFDPYLLAHREKDHLLAPRHYKRVYRNQGWISPVILMDGAVTGVWVYKITGKKMTLTVKSFERVSRAARDKIGQECESLAAFLGTALGACQVAQD